MMLLLPLLQLTKRYEAAVRVCQWNSGTHSRPRNVGNILEKEKEIQVQLKAEGALAA
jgi:Tfp pilus assembly protein PilZ